MKIRRLICLLVALTMVFSMTTITADAASFKSKPTGVKAKCVNGATVNVSCKAKKGATGYCFYYSTKKRGKYTLAAESGSRSARVEGLTAGKTYYFKVQAYQGTDARVYSKMSKPAKCKTVLKKPTVKVTDKCGCKVCLYLKGQEGTKGFAVYRSTKKKKGYKKIKTVNGGPAVSWNDKSVKASTKYYYKVKAVSGKYSTKYSKVISVKTEAWHPDGNDWSFGPANSGKSQYAASFKGRNIFFLGSSITFGSASGGNAIPEFLAARNNLKSFSCVNGNGTVRWTPEVGNGIIWKEAVSGTTMARVKGNTQTYSFRLYQNYKNTTINPDIFVCQLSLNDSFANANVPLGDKYPDIDYDNLKESDITDLYNKAYSVRGAIAFITAFAYKNWPDCQVVFYTVRNNGYNTRYIEMRDVLWDAKAKYGNRIQIIDMWNMSALTNLWGNNYCMYMDDPNHPKMAGYLYQWTPEFESKLAAWMPAMPNWKVEWKNGDEVETDAGLRRGERLSPAAEPTKDGYTDEEGNIHTYTFEGWRNQADGEEGTVYTTEQIRNMTVTGNMTFIASFKETITPKDQQGEGSENNEGDGNPPAPGNGNSGDGKETDSSPEEEPEGEQNGTPDITSMIQTLLRAA